MEMFTTRAQTGGGGGAMSGLFVFNAQICFFWMVNLRDFETHGRYYQSFLRFSYDQNLFIICLLHKTNLKHYFLSHEKAPLP